MARLGLTCRGGGSRCALCLGLAFEVMVTAALIASFKLGVALARHEAPASRAPRPTISPAEARRTVASPAIISSMAVRVCLHGNERDTGGTQRGKRATARRPRAVIRNSGVLRIRPVDPRGAASGPQRSARRQRSPPDCAVRLHKAAFSAARRAVIGPTGSASRHSIRTVCCGGGSSRLRSAQRALVALPGHDEDDGLSGAVVGQAERRGVANRAAGKRGFLYLGGADAVAAELDHRVIAGTKAEQPVGADNHRVPRPKRAVAEALGGAGGVVPIALGDERPRMDQLALLAGPPEMPSGGESRLAKGMAGRRCGCASTRTGRGRDESFGGPYMSWSMAWGTAPQARTRRSGDARRVGRVSGAPPAHFWSAVGPQRRHARAR